MQSFFQFCLAHQGLTWFLFLAPIVVVMLRGMVLDNRAIQNDAPSRYHWMLVAGFVPVVNLAVAVMCILAAFDEWRFRQYHLTQRW